MASLDESSEVERWPLSKIALISALFLVAGATIQYGSNLFATRIRADAEFITVDRDTIRADISHLPAGVYYVSAGRPGRPCGLYLDGALLASNWSPYVDVRSRLLLGSDFVIEMGKRAELLSLVCKDQEGFLGAISHEPVVARPMLGRVLQYWRGLSEMLWGPVAGLLLMFAAVIRLLMSKAEKRGNREFVIFAVISFFYSLSLAHLTRLVVDPGLASGIHMVLRISLSAVVVLLAGVYVGHYKKLLYLHVLAILALSGMFLAGSEYVDPAYRVALILSALISWKILYDVTRVKSPSLSTNVLSVLMLVWAIVQIFGFRVLIKNVGSYFNPTFVASAAMLVGYMIVYELIQREGKLRYVRYKLSIANSLNRLARQVVHDIRSPLMVLRVLQSNSKALPLEEREMLAGVAQRVNEIADELLRKHRAVNEESSAHLPKEEWLVAEALKKVVHETSFAYGHEVGVDVLVDCKDLHNVKAVVPGSSHFKRVIANILTNSFEAGKLKEGPWVDVRSWTDGRTFLIEIHDSGPGLSQERLDSFNEGFFATQGKLSGNGVGLDFVKQVVQSSGGSLRFRSSPYGGLTVSLYFSLI